MEISAKDKKQLMLVGVLIVVFVIALQAEGSRQKNKRARLATKAALSPAKIIPVNNTLNIPAANGQAAGRDPFSGRQINIGIEENEKTMRLTGIVYNPSNKKDSYAIINNSVVKEGDSLANTKFKVSEIKADEVIICEGKATLSLKTW